MDARRYFCRPEASGHKRGRYTSPFGRTLRLECLESRDLLSAGLTASEIAQQMAVIAQQIQILSAQVQIAMIAKQVQALTTQVQQATTSVAASQASAASTAISSPSVASQPAPTYSTVSTPATSTVASQVTLSLYVHEGAANGSVLSGVRVTGQDAAGLAFEQSSDSSGEVELTGKLGEWQFTISKTGYQPVTWTQAITQSTTRHAFFAYVPPSPLAESELAPAPTVPAASTSPTSAQIDEIAQQLAAIAQKVPALTAEVNSLAATKASDTEASAPVSSPIPIPAVRESASEPKSDSTTVVSASSVTTPQVVLIPVSTVPQKATATASASLSAAILSAGSALNTGSSPVAASAISSDLTPNSSAEELAADPRIQAMLDTIAWAEGGDNYGRVVRGEVIRSPNFPELVGQKDVQVTDLSQHPNILVYVGKDKKGEDLYSTAAGRYQIKIGTWNEKYVNVKVPDFTAHSQDVAAVNLLKYRKMVEPLLKGEFDTAVYRGAPEWASLPTSNGAGCYLQKSYSITEVKDKYEIFLSQRLEKAAQVGYGKNTDAPVAQQKLPYLPTSQRVTPVDQLYALSPSWWDNVLDDLHVPTWDGVYAASPKFWDGILDFVAI